MKPLSIFKRLFIGNSVILCLILFLGIMVSKDLKQLVDINQDLINRHQENIFDSERIIAGFNQLVALDEKFFVTKDADYLNRFNDQTQVLKADFNTIRQRVVTHKEKELINKAHQAYQSYLDWFQEQSQITFSKDGFDFQNLRLKRNELTDSILSSITDYRSQTRLIFSQKTQQAGQMTRQIYNITIVTTLLILLAGILITLLNTRSVEQSVQQLKDKTKEIAQGKFEQITLTNGPEEIHDLALHVNTMCLRLKELDELKSDFISHMSHELRTPLTSIKEASQMLRKGFFSDQPDKQEELYELIYDECNRLLDSINRTLDFSKMEAGQMEYHLTTVDLPGVIRKSILKLAPLAMKKEISLEFVPPETELPEINADKNRMIEVLDNLVGNAIKFSPRHGKIRLECIEKDAGHLLVAVTDNGPGIALEYLDNIFYKFKQIDNHMNTRLGSGLGLCLAKYIINAHGGDIWAENVKPNGTRISFMLPVSL